MSAISPKRAARVSRGLYLRYLIAAGWSSSARRRRSRRRACSRSRATSRSSGPTGTRSRTSRARSTTSGRRSADDARARLRPALRRRQARQPGALGHDHARAPGPEQGRDRGHVDPARPEGRDPRARDGEDQRRLRARRPGARGQDGQEPAAHPDQPRRQRELRGLPPRRRPPRLRVRRHRSQVLPSNAGLAPSQQYAEINIQPGYQKLCGQKALDYVRYRHEDSDFVRAARQQDFLRQAKAQIGLGQPVRRPQGAAEDLLGLHRRPISTRRRRSCACSSSPSSPPATRSAR